MSNKNDVEEFLKVIEPILKEYTPEEQECFKKFVRSPETNAEKGKVELLIKSVNSALDLENKVFEDGVVTETEKPYLRTTGGLIVQQISANMLDAVSKFRTEDKSQEKVPEVKNGFMNRVKSFLKKIGLPVAIAATPMTVEAHSDTPSDNKPKIALSIERDTNRTAQARLGRNIEQARLNRLETNVKSPTRQTTLDFSKVDTSKEI